MEVDPMFLDFRNRLLCRQSIFVWNQIKYLPAMVLFYVSCFPVVACSQIGLHLDELKVRFGANAVESPRLEASVGLDIYALTNLPAGEDDSKIWVGVNPKTGLSTANFGYHTKNGLLRGDLNAAQQWVENSSHLVAKELVQPSGWQVHTGFMPVFPSIGQQARGGLIFPVTRDTGRQYKIIQIDVRTGRVIGETPWDDLRVATGQFREVVTSSAKSVNKQVVRSKDGALYGLIGWTYHNKQTSGLPFQGFGDGESLFLNDFVVADVETIWNLMVAATSDENDQYHQALVEVVQPDQLPAIRRKRLALAWVAMADDEKTSLDLLRQWRDGLIELDGEMKTALREEIEANLRKVPRDLWARRIELIREFGSAESIQSLGDLLRDTPNATRTATKQAMRTIAERESVSAPPEDAAPALEWAKWVKSAQKK